MTKVTKFDSGAVDIKQVAERVRGEMERQSLSSLRLAKKAGVDKNFVDRLIKAETRDPSYIRTVKVIMALGVSHSYVACGMESGAMNPQDVEKDVKSTISKINPDLLPEAMRIAERHLSSDVDDRNRKVVLLAAGMCHAAQNHNTNHMDDNLAQWIMNTGNYFPAA